MGGNASLRASRSPDQRRAAAAPRPGGSRSQQHSTCGTRSPASSSRTRSRCHPTPLFSSAKACRTTFSSGTEHGEGQLRHSPVELGMTSRRGQSFDFVRSRPAQAIWPRRATRRTSPFVMEARCSRRTRHVGARPCRGGRGAVLDRARAACELGARHRRRSFSLSSRRANVPPAGQGKQLSSYGVEPVHVPKLRSTWRGRSAYQRARCRRPRLAPPPQQRLGNSQEMPWLVTTS